MVYLMEDLILHLKVHLMVDLMLVLNGRLGVLFETN